MSNHSKSVEPGRSRSSESDASANQRAKYAGKRLGKFQIVGELGRGGMGVVFEARDTVLERNVAIKLLPRSVSTQPEALERFLREARAAAKLSHPHVVGVHDADQFNGQYYIVLELVSGGSLQDSLKTGPLRWETATQVIADACRGLEAAHRAGLVHRDIKPSNLMRGEDGTVKLADFGLVRPNEPTGVTMTGSGSVLGTPQYMSPEQCRSERANEQSDLYSMGATYFALLTGHPPYPGEAPLLVMNAHLQDPIPDPRDFDASIPLACFEIIQRAMAKDPDDRYSNAAEMIAALESLLGGTETVVADLPGSRSPRRQRSPAATVRVQPPSVPKRNTFLWSNFARYWPPSRSVVIGVLICAVIVLGWWKSNRDFNSNSQAESPSADSRKLPPRDDKAEAPPRAAVAMPAGAFRIPGMKWEPQPGRSEHDVWSMDYPHISRVYLPASGEFLVVLSNGPSVPESGLWHSQVTVWNRNGKQLLDESLRGRASSGSISGDSGRLAVGTTGGQGVFIWDTTSWKRWRSPVGQTADYVDGVALSRDGRWLAYTVSKGPQLGEWVLWDLDAQKESQRHVVKGAASMRAVEFVPGDELRVATGGSDGLVRYWRGTQAELLRQTYRAGQPIHAIAFAPGRNLQLTGYGKSCSIWDYQRDVRIFQTIPYAVQVDDVAFSPNGQLVYIAAGSAVDIVDAKTGQSIDRISTFGARVLSMASTPDGSGLYLASADGKLKLCRMAR